MTNFSSIERLAIWEVYNKKCYYCDSPLVRISEMQIEHLFPKELENDEAKFNEIKEQFDLPNDFDLDSYENLVCSCGPCNRKKSNDLWSRNAMLSFHSIAIKNSIAITSKIKELESKLSSSKMISNLKSLLNKAFLRPNEVVELINITECIIEEIHNPIVIMFTKLFNDDGSYPNIKPNEFWIWCERSLEELIKKINENLICLFSICDDDRDGEGYGVRIAFWGLNWEDFNKKFFPTIYNDWFIPEILRYEDLDFWEESAKERFLSLDK